MRMPKIWVIIHKIPNCDDELYCWLFDEHEADVRVDELNSTENKRGWFQCEEVAPYSGGEIK
jgi:hypothetical protein